MRSLFDIVEEVKDNKKPDYEELRYALLVYSFLLSMDHRHLREELLKEERPNQFIRELRAKNSFDMYKGALEKSPKEYLGWQDDPENPEYQKFRLLGKSLFNKAIGVKRVD